MPKGNPFIQEPEDTLDFSDRIEPDPDDVGPGSEDAQVARMVLAAKRQNKAAGGVASVTGASDTPVHDAVRAFEDLYKEMRSEVEALSAKVDALAAGIPLESLPLIDVHAPTLEQFAVLVQAKLAAIAQHKRSCQGLLLLAEKLQGQHDGPCTDLVKYWFGL
jgi:hypothetical protein